MPSRLRPRLCGPRPPDSGRAPGPQTSGRPHGQRERRARICTQGTPAEEAPSAGVHVDRRLPRPAPAGTPPPSRSQAKERWPRSAQGRPRAQDRSPAGTAGGSRTATPELVPALRWLPQAQVSTGPLTNAPMNQMRRKHELVRHSELGTGVGGHRGGRVRRVLGPEGTPMGEGSKGLLSRAGPGPGAGGWAVSARSRTQVPLGRAPGPALSGRLCRSLGASRSCAHAADGKTEVCRARD